MTETAGTMDGRVVRPTTGGGRYRPERMLLSVDDGVRARLTDSAGRVCEMAVHDISANGLCLVGSAAGAGLQVGNAYTVAVSIEGRPLHSGGAVVIHVADADGACSCGVQLLGPHLDMYAVHARMVNRPHDAGLAIWPSFDAQRAVLSPNVRMLFADLRTLFASVKQQLDRAAERIRSLELPAEEERAYITDLVTSAVEANLPGVLQLFAELERHAANLTPEENAAHKSYFRSLFGEIIRRTPFLHRALTKPLGYAGDYGLMLMFYEYEDLGEEIFDKFMHRLACRQPVAVANMNRVGLLTDLIMAHHAQRGGAELVVSTIACGPAREMQLLAERLASLGKRRLHAVLIDQEPRALEYAVPALRRRASSQLAVEVSAYCEDAVLGTVKRRPFTRHFSESEVIVCAGLFDYLPDRVASRMIEQLMRELKPGAMLLIGNVSSEHPNRTSMEYFMEWVLQLRSSEDLVRLVPERLRTEGEFTVQVVGEPLGINLFLQVTRIGPSGAVPV